MPADGRPYESIRGPEEGIASLCTGCPEPPELERLGRFSGRLDLEWTNSPATVPGDEDAPTVPGYAITRRLGEGSMGRVFHARDVRLGREVALKVVLPGRMTAPLIERFRTEARAVARLDHPNIVRVHEVGEYLGPDGPAPYLALEYIPGGTLEARAGRATLLPGVAARVVCLLARAVQHAHERGVIHRDLKPENILLGPAGEAAFDSPLGSPKIADFGLARRDGPGVTLPGMVMGTPAYMAPEQADGREAGPPADVYALGAILYRLLTGQVVFEADTLADTLHHVRHTPPRPPRELAPGTPPSLEEVCLRCLEKDPACRPTAAELAAALDLPPAAAVATVPGVRASAHPGRRWPMYAAGAALTLVAAAAWLLRPANATPPPPPLTGYIDARMSRPGDSLRQDVPLRDPAARPLRMMDEVRLHVELSRPAYCYIVWVDTDGVALPIYPWIGHRWDRRSPDRKVASLRWPPPEDEKDSLKMGPGRPGLETMLLLCRDEPLPESAGFDGMLGGLDPLPAQGAGLLQAAWFRDGQTVRDEEGRGPLAEPVEGGNAAERLNREIHRRVKGLFTLTRAVTFGNEGGER